MENFWYNKDTKRKGVITMYENIKKICDHYMGDLNYSVFDVDGKLFLPEGIKLDKNLDLSGELPSHFVPICGGGEVMGWIASPSGYRKVAAEKVAELIMKGIV